MAESKSGKSRHILLAVRIAVVVVGLALAAFWIFSERIWTDLKDAFARMDLWVFACVFAVFCLSQLTVGVRWWLLLRTQKIFISFGAALRLYLLGWFYNNVMPGSVGGDLIRLWYVTKHTEKKFEAGLSVLIDRFIGLISTLIIALFFYSMFMRSENIRFTGRKSPLLGYWWVAVLTIFVVLGGLSAHKHGRSLLKKVWSSGSKAFIRLLAACKLYGRNPLMILVVFALTVILQIATITGFWFLGSNIGIEVGIKYYYVFFTLVWVIGTIPVSIAGAGVVEGALVVLFVTVAEVPKADAMALALLQRFIWLLASLPGAVIHLTGTHLPKDFSVDSDGLGK